MPEPQTDQRLERAQIKKLLKDSVYAINGVISALCDAEINTPEVRRELLRRADKMIESYYRLEDL